MYEAYQNRSFRVLGFPSDTFHQEPGTPQQIAQFITKFNVTFDMFNRSDVKPLPVIDGFNPLFAWLCQIFPSLCPVQWNFSLKVVFDNYGRPLRGYGPTDGGTYVMYKNITIFVKQMLDARDQQLAEMKMAMTQL